MLKQELEIINKLGLHARASAKLTQTAGQFKADIFVSKAGKRVNAKSIMGVMMLAAGRGAMVNLEVDGPDEEACFSALQQLIQARFGEGE